MHSISTPKDTAFNKTKFFKNWITQILQLFLTPNRQTDINVIHQRSYEINALVY